MSCSGLASFLFLNHRRRPHHDRVFRRSIPSLDCIPSVNILPSLLSNEPADHFFFCLKSTLFRVLDRFISPINQEPTDPKRISLLRHSRDKLAQLPPHHLLRDQDILVRLPVVDGEPQAQEIGQDRCRARARLDHRCPGRGGVGFREGDGEDVRSCRCEGGVCVSRELRRSNSIEV